MQPVRLLAAVVLIGFSALSGLSRAEAQDLPGAQEAGTPEMPGAADVARVSGGTYTVDPDHTQVIWTVDHMGFSPLTGMFGKMSGTLVLDPKAPEDAKLDIKIPLAGLVVTSEEFGKHLASPDFFDTAKFAEASFKSTNVTAEGTEGAIEGELTLHGVTRPITLETTFFGAGINPMTKAENIGFVATTTIKRSEFGLGFAVPIVSDEVELDVVGVFAKGP